MDLDFSNSCVLVIGDVILDRYYYGKVNRISPEAPVPVVKITKERHSPGGSGNVVNNIKSLGAKAFHISLTGKDQNADILTELLENQNIENRLIATDKPTITKIRVIGEHQQVVRLDFEEIYSIDRSTHNEIIAAIDSAIDKAGAVVISDYGKGICTPDICRHVIHISNSKGIPVIVDPKGYDWNKYKNAAVVTPNVKELAEVAGREIRNEDQEIEKYASRIMNEYSLQNIIVTRSDKGMTLVTKDAVNHIPTHAQEVYDVSGAGDTVVAALAVALAGNMSMIESAGLANRAAGIVVGKFGTASVELDELIHSFHTGPDSKILTLKVLARIVEQLNNKNKRIVFTSLRFDALNIKIVNSLKAAKKNGDTLIAGVINDSLDDNAYEAGTVIASLECVDYVVMLLAGESLPDIIAMNKNIKKIV